MNSHIQIDDDCIVFIRTISVHCIVLPRALVDRTVHICVGSGTVTHQHPIVQCNLAVVLGAVRKYKRARIRVCNIIIITIVMNIAMKRAESGSKSAGIDPKFIIFDYGIKRPFQSLGPASALGLMVIFFAAILPGNRRQKYGSTP